MATVRVPFAPLDNPRLLHLASAKNRQNGAAPLSTATKGKGIAQLNSPSAGKRTYEASALDEFDSENVDPTMLGSPSKKSKSTLFDQPIKPLSFSFTTKKSMLPPSVVPKHLSTPVKTNSSAPRTPMTAPAGRSPPRKTAGVFKTRRTSTPFSRIEPPFGTRTSSSLPFSLDAAISGTLPSSTPKTIGATIQESVPKAWLFDIYQDTPEEEAANLMEHSTLTLDLSSDDESSKMEKNDRGKENTPPEGYDAPTASRAHSEAALAANESKKTEIVRKKIVIDEMDDGERSPLSDLETEPFFPDGLDRGSQVIVDGTAEQSTAKFTVNDLFGAPVTFGSSKETSSSDLSFDGAKKTGQGDIVIYEDSTSSTSPSAVPTCTVLASGNDENKS